MLSRLSFLFRGNHFWDIWKACTLRVMISPLRYEAGGNVNKEINELIVTNIASLSLKTLGV